MVSLAAISFPCAQRNCTVTSLVLIQGLVLARRVPCALFAMFAPRKADAVGVMGMWDSYVVKAFLTVICYAAIYLVQQTRMKCAPVEVCTAEFNGMLRCLFSG